MTVEIKAEGDSYRVRTDREGERAVSDLLNRDEATAHLEALAGLLGYTVSPTGSTGPVSGPGAGSGDAA